MKGKKILAFASIFAGVALVGTTFAASAWAVTDNAGTKTIKISGEKINSDTGTGYVTLEYGSHTELSDVANLVAGTKRYAGAAGLVATYTGAESYNGLLTLSMSQPAREGVRLIDYVKVYVYDTNVGLVYDQSNKVVSAVPTATPIITLNGAVSASRDGSVSISMPQTEKMVYFVVEMIAEGVDATVLGTIKSDVINVTVDWDHDTNNQTVATSKTVYYKPSGAKDGEVYCYAWKGKVPNAEYPGLPMTKEADGVYSYVINTTTFENFILSYNDNDGVNHKAREADFEVTDVVGTDNYWNGTSWGKRPVADATLTADYYVVGDMAVSGWACKPAYAMDKDSVEKDDATQDTYVITGVSFAAGQQIKVRNNSNNANEEWYSNVTTWDNCGFTISDGGNVVVTAAGTYTVRLYRNSNQNNHIVLSRTGD